MAILRSNEIWEMEIEEIQEENNILEFYERNYHKGVDLEFFE